MKHHRIGMWITISAAIFLAATTPGCTPRSDPAAGAGSVAVAGPAGDAFKAAGRDASLGVLPTRVAGQSLPPVGEVVAMMLERAGMTSLELIDQPFSPQESADLQHAAHALAEHVREYPPACDYVLFTDFIGTPKTGFTEFRGIVVSKSGAIVWQDKQTKGDPGFDIVKPREPMQGCLLIALRLRPVLGLSDPAAGGPPSGRISKAYAQRTGIPDKAELKAIESRGAAFRKAAATSTILVYAPHTAEGYSMESAEALAAGIAQAGLARATAADAEHSVEITRSINQQQALWSMARSVSTIVRQEQPDADYVLFADYLMAPGAAAGAGGVGGVNFVICDRRGEIVAVDLQNSHQPDFKAIRPKTRQDCDRLLLKRFNSLAR